jgi:hypothetical protein
MEYFSLINLISSLAFKDQPLDITESVKDILKIGMMLRMQIMMSHMNSKLPFQVSMGTYI